MPTISNTSPLLNLAIIGELERVRSQFGQVLVPPSVVEEFRLEEGRPGSPALKEAIEEGRILTESPSNRPLIRTLRQDLDRGESVAIALATAKNADRILLDEREGRRRARNIGLKVTGALGILSRAEREEKLRTGLKRKQASGSPLHFENRSSVGPNREKNELPVRAAL